MIVAPRPLNAGNFFGDKAIRFTGPAVVSSFSFGGTSGRFGVWSAITRYFPAKLRLVDRRDWSDTHEQPLPSGPYPTDLIVTRSDRSVRTVTLGGTEGEGTSGYLSRGPLPVIALRQLMGPDDELSLLAVDVRLPVDQHDLATAILDNPGGSE